MIGPWLAMVVEGGGSVVGPSLIPRRSPIDLHVDHLSRQLEGRRLVVDAPAGVVVERAAHLRPPRVGAVDVAREAPPDVDEAEAGTRVVGGVVLRAEDL